MIGALELALDPAVECPIEVAFEFAVEPVLELASGRTFDRTCCDLHRLSLRRFDLAID